MKIAILSRWNTACGVSLHAELIGREFVENGHNLTVFAPSNIRPVGKDEHYVVRCFSDEGDPIETFFYPEPFSRYRLRNLGCGTSGACAVRTHPMHTSFTKRRSKYGRGKLWYQVVF